MTALVSQLLFYYSLRHHKQKELQKRWKLAGKFVSVEDAAALCVQAHFKKHSVMIHQYRQKIYATVLQSAFRGAVLRRKLGTDKQASFGTIAMNVAADAALQRAVHATTKTDHMRDQLNELRAEHAATEAAVAEASRV